MTDKITLTDIANLQNETTVVNAINNNNAAIVAAMNNTLSRDGAPENQMEDLLDMNGFAIINLPAPMSGSSPARLEDLAEVAGGGTVNFTSIPSGGTLNQALVKDSSTNLDIGWKTVVPNGGTTGQSLTKNSSTNLDTGWKYVVPTGGTTGQSLTKNSGTDLDIGWSSPASAGVASYNGRTGPVVTQGSDFAGMTLLYEGLQPLKRPDLGNFHIGVNAGCFADSNGSAVYNSPNVLVCNLNASSIDASGLPSSPIVGCCLSPGVIAGATTIFDGIDFMPYICKRNSDNQLALFVDNSNVYGGSTAGDVAVLSNSWSTGGPPIGCWNGTKVRLTVTPGGTIPAPFGANTDYYIVNATNGQLSTTFGLAGSYGGGAITCTGSHTGLVSFHYGVQDHLDGQFGAGTWSVLRGVHFGWRWKWQWPGAGGGIPDFTQDPRSDRVNLTYGGTSGFAVNSIAGGGLATSPATIDCTNVLSNLNRWASVRAVITSNSGAGTVFMGPPGGGTTNMRPMGEAPTSGTTTTYAYSEIATDSTGLMSYYVTGGAKLLNVYIEGWTFVDPR